MRSIFLLFGAALLIIVTPVVFVAIQDARTDDYSEVFTEITTGGGVTTANVTLALDMWGDEVSSVNSVSSNTTGENPTASAYVAATRQLTIGGLNSSDTRTLTVDYQYEASTVADLDSTGPLFIIIVWFWALGILALIVGGCYQAYATIKE